MERGVASEVAVVCGWVGRVGRNRVFQPGEQGGWGVVVVWVEVERGVHPCKLNVGGCADCEHRQLSAANVWKGRLQHHRKSRPATAQANSSCSSSVVVASWADSPAAGVWLVQP